MSREKGDNSPPQPIKIGLGTPNYNEVDFLKKIVIIKGGREWTIYKELLKWLGIQ